MITGLERISWKLNQIIGICVKVVKWLCSLIGRFWGQSWRKEYYLQWLAYPSTVVTVSLKSFPTVSFVNKYEFNIIVLSVDSFY